MSQIINAIANNFGTGAIQFKAFCSEDLIILNGSFIASFNPYSPQAPSQMEVSVPDLPFGTSEKTAVYVRGMNENGEAVSIACTWIKDKNTIAIEIPNLPNWGIDKKYEFNCAFVPNGRHSMIFSGSTTELSLANGPAACRIKDQQCIVRPDWVSLFIGFDELRCAQANTQFSFDLVGLPNDIDADFPLISNVPGVYNTGSFDAKCHISGNRVTCEGLCHAANDAGGSTFLKAFFVRG